MRLHWRLRGWLRRWRRFFGLAWLPCQRFRVDVLAHRLDVGGGWLLRLYEVEWPDGSRGVSRGLVPPGRTGKVWLDAHSPKYGN